MMNAKTGVIGGDTDRRTMAETPTEARVCGRTDDLIRKIDQTRESLCNMVAENGWAPSSAAFESESGNLAGPNKLADERQIQVSLKTLQDYRGRGEWLLSRCLREVGLMDDVLKTGESAFNLLEPMRFVEWLSDLRPSISPSTWRVYRRGALAILPVTEDGLLASEALEALTSQGTKRIRKNDKKPKSPSAKTSARRLMAVGLNDLVDLTTELNRRASLAGRSIGDQNRPLVLQDWLIAGLATGLRPVEWRQSRLIFEGTEAEWPRTEADQYGCYRLADDKPLDAFAAVGQTWMPASGRVFMVIAGTKHSNGRGNLATRVLDLSELPAGIMRCVARMIWRGAAAEERWKQTYAHAADMLYRIQRQIWPERRALIQLYSCRHQTLANLKYLIGTLESAVIAGHATVDGPIRHYVRQSNAWARRKQRNDENSVAELNEPGEAMSAISELRTLEPPGIDSSEKAALIGRAGIPGLARLARRDNLKSILSASLVTEVEHRHESKIGKETSVWLRP